MSVTSDMGLEILPDAPRKVALRGTFETVVPLLALVLLIIATALSERWLKGSSNFLKVENLLNVLRQLSPIGVVSLGMTFVIIGGGIDLSVGSLVAMAGGVGIWMMNTVLGAKSILQDMSEARQFHSELPYWVATEKLARYFFVHGWAGNEAKAVWIGIGAMILAAGLAGWFNGFLVARGKLAPFIATLGGFAAYRSIALAMADGGEFRSASIHLFPVVGTSGVRIPFVYVRPGLNPNDPGVNAVLSYPAIIFLGMAVVAAVLLNKTRFGRYVQAIGSNERAAVYSAINVSRVRLWTYLLGGLTCGVAALLIGSRLNSISSSQTGTLYELDAIAAVVIGGTRMSGGRGTIFGTVIGVLILGVIGNMLNFLNVSPYLQGLVKGGIIVVAVLVQRVGQRGR